MQSPKSNGGAQTIGSERDIYVKAMAASGQYVPPFAASGVIGPVPNQPGSPGLLQIATFGDAFKMLKTALDKKK